MKVLYVTDMRFPANDAPSKRIMYISKMLLKLQYEVLVLGRGNKGDGVIDGIEYYSFRGKQKDIVHKLYYYTVFAKNVLSVINTEKPDIVIVYNISAYCMKILLKNKDIYNYRIINDCVEWYSKCQSSFFSMTRIDYYKRNYWMKHVLSDKIGVIAISKYLYNYCNNKDIKVCYIPAVCDIERNLDIDFLDSKPVRIVYAGSPGKKDEFAPILSALKLLNDSERQNILLNIIGASEDAICKNAGVSKDELRDLKGCLCFIPRMSREEVIEYIKNSHYSILIRPSDARYAKAGFPTKVPESLAEGTPVICNYTSDLALYLQDEVDCIVVKDNTTKSVYDAFKRIINMDNKIYSSMRINAKMCAIKYFDYNLYCTILDDFIKSL